MSTLLETKMKNSEEINYYNSDLIMCIKGIFQSLHVHSFNQYHLKKWKHNYWINELALE